MKICSKCSIEKDESEFNKKSSTKDGLQTFCKECNKKNCKSHYGNNRKYYDDRNNERKKDIRNYVDSKKTKCSNCGEDHIACLDFHHLKDKEIDLAMVTAKSWSKNRIDKEIAKCIILCANCHRKLHWQEKNYPVV